MKLMMQQ
jgi:hypothetical protein